MIPPYDDHDHTLPPRFPERRYLLESGESTWDELAEANEADTMEEIARIPVGETWTIGQCDRVTRLHDAAWWMSNGDVLYRPRTDWERRAIMANGFTLRQEGVYGCEDSSAARYAAETIRTGGVG